MKNLSVFIIVLGTALFLTGCVHKVVTTPVKVAYGVTKGAVKGTAAVVKAVVPGDKDDDKRKRQDKDDD